MMGILLISANICLCLLAVSAICAAVSPHVGQIRPGFTATQAEWSEQNGQFLLSNNSAFSFGFYRGIEDSAFVLVVLHVSSSRVVWTANRHRLVSNSDKFVFNSNGSAYLQRDAGVVWSADTAGKKATAMVLQNSGNLVLIGDDNGIMWQSFSYPTDTLLTGQDFVAGMKLKSFPNKNNESVFLEILSGDLVLFIGYQTPQIYWSISSDSRGSNLSRPGSVYSASLVSNSWNFYDKNRALLCKFVFSANSGEENLWAAILGADGSIIFENLNMGKSVAEESTKIPQNTCSIPEQCDPYSICYFSNWCQCPDSLISPLAHCKLQPLFPSCDGSNSVAKSEELVYVGERLDYFALDFAAPVLKPNLNSCMEACRVNCSCNVLFFNSSSGKCFMFDQIGNYQRSETGDTGYVSYMKISTSGRKSNKNDALMISLITVATIVVIAGLVYLGYWYFHRTESKQFDNLEDDNDSDKFLDSLSGGPVRFRYSDLSQATKNFSTRIGQGGFGSVYLGVLPDGTRLAVKKLEGLGQGKREFRSEVTIIGSLHHVHLVRLRGFCAEGDHRLLVYEYMANGSLDRWIFKNTDGGPLMDWDTRYNIGLGTAKGLAYLHEECEAKIIHCDIKPENVLLDDNFLAKVSDFGLAKLTSRDESLIYTTMRGTRGYLAPEWITNNPISAKTDVYSYGMVLLEIIGGRKNYKENSEEKPNLPVYAFKMLEEGRLLEIVDPTMKFDKEDERVMDSIKIALWCIQEEMGLRPPMTKVVQMLEGTCLVPHPPTSTHLINSVKWSSEDGSSSQVIDWSSDAFLSDVRLSGPR